MSVGICVRNCEETIDEVIRSIIHQDFPHELMELIIVDDGSTDGTLKRVKKLVSRINIRTKVYRQNWKGLGATRNVVVQNAHGRYVIWVDGDMKLPRDFVRRQVEFMDIRPKVGAAKGRYKILESKNLVATLENARALYLQSSSSKLVGTGGSIYRVKAIKEAGGFDERIKGAGEDIDALIRMREKGWLLSTTNAEFYEQFKETVSELWLQYCWWGYGAHYVHHKHKHAISVVARLLPVAFLIGIFRFFRAYRSYHKLTYLLLPFHNALKETAWCVGFIKSHVDGYGYSNKQDANAGRKSV